MPWERAGLSRAGRVSKFLEWLPVTKGIRAGRKMRLLPTQRDFVEDLYREGREVEIRIAVFSEPKGNGKTGLLSGLSLCHLLGPEAEPRGEIYSAATDRSQAAILFAEMEAIILAVPEFDQRVNIVRFHKTLEVLGGPGKGSTYAALSSDVRKVHGLAPSLWVYDELAQARDGELLDNLQASMGKRDRALGVVISTQAPSDSHPLSQLIDDGLSGTAPDILVKLICAPEDADPFDPKVIRACNPALGKFLNVRDVMADAAKAKRMPSFERKYRNLRLNQRTALEGRLVPPHIWKANAGLPDLDCFRWGRVRIGLDLSARHDLTALVGVATHKDALHVHAEFFAPREGIEERSTRDAAPYDIWAEQGYITLTEGASVDYEVIAKRLIELDESGWQIEAIPYDRWRIDVLEKELARLGRKLPLVPFGQGFKDMSPAIDEFESVLLNRRMRHGANPVLTMCIDNAVVMQDDAGNRKFSKRLSTARIDGAVALAMAVAQIKSERPPEYQLFFA